MDLALAMFAGLAVVWVPGAITTRALRIASPDATCRFAQELALGLSFWPVLLLWTTLGGLKWSPTVARVVFAALCVVLIVLCTRRRNPYGQLVPGTAALALIALVAFTRIRQIQGIVLPLWVDSVHHTMIVRLIVDQGHLPSSYAPFIADSAFYYHWGFHAVVAFVAWISGLTSPAQVPRLLLGFGQLLNVLMFFEVYLGAVSLFRNRRVGLLAATLATLVSLFPAYYVSWGRYTQLCGLLLLPAIASVFWQLGRHPTVSRFVELAWLGSGLLLIHVRVAIVFAILATVLGVVLAMQRRWQGVASCAAAGAVAVLMASPWLMHLATTPQVRTLLAPADAELVRWETPNAVPADILWAPHNAILFALATGGLLGLTPSRLDFAVRVGAIAWWVALIIILQRSAKRRRNGVDRRDVWRIGIVVLWIAIIAILVNFDRFGLPRLRVLTNGTAIIMLFLPASIVGAHLVRWALDKLMPSLRSRHVMTIGTLLIGAVGASMMLHIVNPGTVLATEADRVALAWIREHTPPKSRFAVGVQPWIGDSFIGIDGGYWIPLLTERQTVLPPGLYPWVMPRDRVEVLTHQLRIWYEAQQAGNADILNALRRDGVTHLYFGPRNATPMRQTTAASELVARIYSADGVAIYAFRPANSE